METGHDQEKPKSKVFSKIKKIGALSIIPTLLFGSIDGGAPSMKEAQAVETRRENKEVGYKTEMKNTAPQAYCKAYIELYKQMQDLVVTSDYSVKSFAERNLESRLLVYTAIAIASNITHEDNSFILEVNPHAVAFAMLRSEQDSVDNNPSMIYGVGTGWGKNRQTASDAANLVAVHNAVVFPPSAYLIVNGAETSLIEQIANGKITFDKKIDVGNINFEEIKGATDSASIQVNNETLFRSKSIVGVPVADVSQFWKERSSWDIKFFQPKIRK